MASAVKTDPINQLEENLQCSVCLEALTDPRTLPCCHSFCKHCLEGVVKTCRDKAARDVRPIREFPCPDCRTMFTLEHDKHVADMPRNHFISNMLQIAAVLDRGTRVPCSHNCSQSSVARCVTCEKFLCQECLTVHNNYRGHCGHCVLTMEELSKPENRAKIKGKMYCNEHSGKTLKIYCETCDQLICKHCMDFKHVKQNHSCLLVKDVASNYKGLLASNNKEMDDALTEGNRFLQQLSQKTAGLDGDVENAKRLIVQRRELMAKKVVEMLNQKAETLLKEVEGIHKSERAKLDSQTNETKLYVENIKQSVQLSKKLVDQGTEEEIISSQKMMLENANDLLKKRSEYFKDTMPVTTVSYVSYASISENLAVNEEVYRVMQNCFGKVITDKVARTSVVNKMSDSSNTVDNFGVPSDQYDRTVFASGFPEEATENTVHIHFQKKKNGGGDVEKVTLLRGGKALVLFKEPEVAEMVVNCKQNFRENILEVKGLWTEKSKKEKRTVLVSGLPEGATKNSVCIHFQKKKNGGGEVEKVQVLEKGKVLIVFESSQVAKHVVCTEQRFQGNVLQLEFAKTEMCVQGKTVKSKDEECTICLSPFTDKKVLDKCGHSFCAFCIDEVFKYQKKCPICSQIYGPLFGNQPPGRMSVSRSRLHLGGFELYGTIHIIYKFESGIQGPEHPNPGKTYKGTQRTAYLPDNEEGRKVLKLLQKAFAQQLTFTIGRSTTSGVANAITWNEIHHKTSMGGGPANFGYPDPGYLKRVQDELAAKGITE